MIPITLRGVAAAALALSVLGVGAGLASNSKGGDSSTADSASTLGCTIGNTVSGGQIILSPQARSVTAVSGSYQFSVRGGGAGGTSSINQGGNFKVPAGGNTTLGSLSLSGDASYEVTLDVTAGIASAHCSKTVTGG